MLKGRELYISAAACALLAAAPNGAKAQVTQLEDVVVTAERVESSVQKTPIAISTISGDEVQRLGVADSKDLNRLVPGLEIRGSGQGSAFFLRGVGASVSNAYGDQAVAFSLDQLYFSRPYGPDMVFYDLQRVEVLKGPQGTLYGRNATAGAINVISQKPILREFSGHVSAELGNFDLVKVEGAANIPLTENLAVRSAFQSIKRDGYNTDGYNDADNVAARLHLFWQPSDRWSLLVSANYMNDQAKGPGVVPYENNRFLTSNPWYGASEPLGVAYVLARSNATGNRGDPARGRPWYVETDGYTDNVITSLAADLEVDLGFAQLTVLPGYMKTKSRIRWYNGATAITANNPAEQTSFEARLGSKGTGPLRWILGAYYQSEDQSYDGQFDGTGANWATFNVWPDIGDKTYAAFGQATWSVTDALRLTLGVRYTREEKESANAISAGLANGVTRPPGFPYVQPAVLFPPSFYNFTRDTQQEWESTNYRAAAEWDWREGSMVYASYATGFHAGGLVQGAPQQRPLCVLPNVANCDFVSTYEPEELTAYTVGSKNRFFDNRLQLNAEAYYWKYKDLQVSHLGLINPGVNSLRVDNAGDAEIKGVEVDINWLITEHDLFAANVDYKKSKYGTYRYVNVVAGRTAIIDNTGRDFLGTPDLAATVRYTHTFDLSNGAKLDAGVRSRYSGDTIFGFASANVPYDVRQDAYWRTDLEATYFAPEERWSLTGYVRNVDDVAAVQAGGGATPATGTPWATPLPPRTYGVILRATF